MAAADPSHFLADFPAETQEKMAGVFAWFNEHVSRLESAYRELLSQFERISVELEEKNQKLTQALSENESVRNQLRSVLESVDSAVVMIDPKQTITLYNPAAERIYGISAETALGQSYSQIFGALADSDMPLLRTLESHSSKAGAEKWWPVHEIYKPIGYTTSLVRDPQGEVLGAVEIASDLTELKRLQREMQHAQTLAALGEMAATVAHEIRNPLAGIGGFAGLLERDLETDDPRRALVRKIVQGVSSLNKIVSNLLVFTRPMELGLRKISFTDWMEEILRYAEVEIAKEGKNIKIERDFGKGEIAVRIDPEKFQQVFLNLIFNAIQSMESEGVLTLRARSMPNDVVNISVSDTGKGIAKDNLGKIFNPFFTTKEQGTGLGLAIVQRIVALHGGRISVISELGKGTTFEVDLDPRGTLHG